MPKCYQLVGVPGSGKSTWYSEQEWLGEDKKDHKYVSTDQHVEGYAKETFIYDLYESLIFTISAI
jgi:hypothetical protein